jgi:hypothetical protein
MTHDDTKIVDETEETLEGYEESPVVVDEDVSI